MATDRCKKASLNKETFPGQNPKMFLIEKIKSLSDEKYPCIVLNNLKA
jgi:hypothetical protein